MRTVRDDEAAIDTAHGVQGNDENLNGEVEAIESRFGKIPRSWGSCRNWGQEIGSRAEGGTKCEEGGGERKNLFLGTEPTDAKFLDVAMSGDEEANDDKEERQEGNDGIECAAVKLDVTIDLVRVSRESEERLNHDSEEHDEGNDDAEKEKGEEAFERE